MEVKNKFFFVLEKGIFFHFFNLFNIYINIIQKLIWYQLKIWACTGDQIGDSQKSCFIRESNFTLQSLELCILLSTPDHLYISSVMFCSGEKSSLQSLGLEPLNLKSETFFSSVHDMMDLFTLLDLLGTQILTSCFYNSSIYDYSKIRHRSLGICTHFTLQYNFCFSHFSPVLGFKPLLSKTFYSWFLTKT